MKVKDLKKALRGLDDNLEVYTYDHDHSKYEVNGLARKIIIIDKSDATKEEEHEYFDDLPKRYVIIKP